MVISAIQRGIFTPKRSVCQHRNPPIKGISINQGNSIAKYVPYILTPEQAIALADDAWTSEAVT
jgi:hypothetical protein